MTDVALVFLYRHLTTFGVDDARFDRKEARISILHLRAQGYRGIVLSYMRCRELCAPCGYVDRFGFDYVYVTIPLPNTNGWTVAYSLILRPRGCRYRLCLPDRSRRNKTSCSHRAKRLISDR